MVTRENESIAPAARSRGVLLALVGVLLAALPFLPAPPQRLSPLDPALIKHNGGHAYTVNLRDLALESPLPTTGVELTEDAGPLRIDHMHNDIRSAGRGRYSPWGWTLYFSSTDNSDPRTNGRAYVLTLRRSWLKRATGDAPWSSYLSMLLVATGVFACCRSLQGINPSLAARARAGLMQPSSFDLRCIVRIALVYSAWRQASADYSALPRLVQGVNLHTLTPRWLDHMVDTLQHIALDTAGKTALVQIAAVTLLIFAAVRVRRWTVLLALAPTLLLEWVAYHFRGQLPDLDPMLAVLVIAALWPGSWRAVTQPGRAASVGSIALGLTIASYIGAVYFICGWSKVITDGPWWKVVRLDLLYAAMVVWMGASPPEWLDPVARGLQRLFARWTFLGEWSSLLTMILELAWPLALVSRVARWSIPLVMLAAHGIIFFSSGILFLPLALIGISVVLPWRRLLGKARTETDEQEPEPRHRAWMVWPMAAATVLVILPAMHSVDAFPFSNWMHFNWNHSTLLQPTVAYRLGYRDRNTGEVHPVPLNHGGFLDCWSVSLAGREVDQYLNAQSDAQRAASGERLLQYARALRPHRSAQRLGWFSCPPHVLGASDAVPVEWFDDLRLLSGRFEDPQHSLDVEWQDRGALPGWPEQAAP